LAVASLELTAETIYKDLRYFGFLFENLVLRDLLVYASIIDAHIYYYSDNSGLEIDVIITKNNK
jgi:predicted AAA+ superfamily ATPase